MQSVFLMVHELGPGVVEHDSFASMFGLPKDAGDIVFLPLRVHSGLPIAQWWAML